MSEQQPSNGEMHQELSEQHHDPLIRWLHGVIRFTIRVLAVLMVLVILWGTVDIVYVIAIQAMEPPVMLLQLGDIFEIFSAFMVVLIAIEIFINIRLYLGSNVLPVQLVIATALMAAARKVIVLDLATTSAMQIFSLGAIIFALGFTYWILSGKEFQFPIGVETKKIE